ncbi:MAG: hypothetical protein GY754_18950, partial [bacterium]|nr:hypothetical protein [bacterium]
MNIGVIRSVFVTVSLACSIFFIGCYQDDAVLDEGAVGIEKSVYIPPVPSVQIPYYAGIGHFTLGSAQVNNSIHDAYTNNTATVFNTLKRGGKYGLRIRVEKSGGGTTSYSYRTYMWIDWNGNSVFDSNEEYILGDFDGTSSTGSLQKYHFSSVTVPADAVLGDILVRVRMQDVYSSQGPSANFLYGETEDFRISVIEPSGIPAVEIPYYAGITSVSLNGANNTSSMHDAYTNNMGSVFTSLDKNSSYSLTLCINKSGGGTTSYSYKTYMWIDWNGNSVFEAGEEYEVGEFGGSSSSGALSKYISTTITVPAAAVTGNITVRLKMQDVYSAQGPHMDFGYGETEDYMIAVNGGSVIPSVEIPYYAGIAHFTLGSAQVNNSIHDAYTDNTATVFNTLKRGGKYGLRIRVEKSGGGTTSYSYRTYMWIDWNGNSVFDSNEEYILGDFDGTSSTGSLQKYHFKTISVPADAVPGDILVRVKMQDVYSSSGPNTDFRFGETEDFRITVIEPSGIPVVEIPYYAGITRVMLNGANNTSSMHDAYTNNTGSVFTNLYKNSSYSLTLCINKSGGGTTSYSYKTYMWIDWNGNSVFEAGEEYEVGEFGGSSSSG